MKKNSLVILIILIVSIKFGFSQNVDLFGKVQSTSDIENIHVINKTAQKFTITNNSGEFRISVSLNDTLVFTSVQHKLVSILVDEQIMLDKILVVTLEEQINELDQVVVGKVLSGNILQDLGNVEGEPMTSKQAGIPSYQGKLKTQSERKVNEATTGGGFIPLFPIINAITGRTKQLKNQVKLEEKETLMYRIKARLSDNLFEMNPLHEDYIMDYFYFVSENDDFLKRCKNVNDIEVLEYLQEKLLVYQSNLSIKSD